MGVSLLIREKGTTMEGLLHKLNGLDISVWGGPALIALRITLIGVLAWIAAAIINRGIRTFRRRIAMRMHESEQVKRAETLARVLRYLVSVVLSVISGVLILSELGV